MKISIKSCVIAVSMFVSQVHSLRADEQKKFHFPNTTTLKFGEEIIYKGMEGQLCAPFTTALDDPQIVSFIVRDLSPRKGSLNTWLVAPVKIVILRREVRGAWKIRELAIGDIKVSEIISFTASSPPIMLASIHDPTAARRGESKSSLLVWKSDAEPPAVLPLTKKNLGKLAAP